VPNAIAVGMTMKESLEGVNPYRLPFIASTDTHNGTPGNVKEDGWPGHVGVLDDEPKDRLGFWACDNQRLGENPEDPSNCTNREFLDWSRPLSPGGLAGVWAHENRRESIWDALHRGEVFATSGPRIQMRMIGAWGERNEGETANDGFPPSVCDRLAEGTNPIDLGEDGALMGGNLPARPPNGVPSIAVWALQDAAGKPLQRIDVVKGWVDGEGKPKVKVFPAVASTSAEVLPPERGSCAAHPATHPEQLCAVWTDPEFESGENAYYYARVLEIPTCRWSAHQCEAKRVERGGDFCDELDVNTGLLPESLRGYEGCCARDVVTGELTKEHHFHVIEERAWASPIWYDAVGGAGS
ncbi:MAG: DUF3604 domain-containing protein, partial [Candidatus Binatia bacterium]